MPKSFWRLPAGASDAAPLIITVLALAGFPSGSVFAVPCGCVACRCPKVAARAAVCCHCRQERGIHPALPPGCGRNSRYAANDKLRELRLILPRFVVNGQCDLLRPAVGRTRLGGAELAGWLRIEHVVAVADIDLGLFCRSPC